MHKQELNEAFSKLHASEALKKEVLMMDMEKKRGLFFGINIRRVAVCTTLVITLLISVFALGNTTPYFTVRVYANETDSVTLNRQGYTFFVSAYDETSTNSREDDPSYRPELDSTLFDDKPLWDEPRFWLQLWLDDKTINHDQIIIFVDGQRLDQNYQNGFWGYISKGDARGRFIALAVERTTYINIVLYDDDGKVLQEYGMEVEPAEGGWYVTLDKAYITSLGAAVFRKFS